MASGSSAATSATSALPAFSHVSASISGSSSGSPANGSGSGIVGNPKVPLDGPQVALHLVEALDHGVLKFNQLRAKAPNACGCRKLGRGR